MKVIYQKVTLFFIALTMACATAQPLLAKYVRRQKQSVAVQKPKPAGNETFRSVLQAGLYTGAASMGLMCLQSISSLRQMPVISGLSLVFSALFAKLYVTLAADIRDNRDGTLSRFIKNDGPLSHLFVGTLQALFGGFVSIVAPSMCIYGFRNIDTEGGLRASRIILGSIGALALGAANYMSGAQKLYKACNFNVESSDTEEQTSIAEAQPHATEESQ